MLRDFRVVWRSPLYLDWRNEEKKAEPNWGRGHFEFPHEVRLLSAQGNQGLEPRRSRREAVKAATKSIPIHCRRGSGAPGSLIHFRSSVQDFVFRFDQAAFVGLRGDVTELYVVRERAEKGDSVSDQDGDAGDGDALDQACAQEALHGDAAIDIDVPEAATGKLRVDLLRRARHLFDLGSGRGGKIDWAAAEDDDLFAGIRPLGKSEDGLESLAADHEGIDAGHKFVVAVRFAAIGGQEVVGAVTARDKAIEAGSDEDRELHDG